MPNVLEQTARDLRYALRQLRRSPFFSVTAVLTFALAIGATSAMVGVLRATLLSPLGYPEPSRLVTITDHNLRGFRSNGLVTVLRTQDLAEATDAGHPVFSSVGFYYTDDGTLTLPGATPLRVPAVGVSGGFFPTAGTPAALGRTLTPADDAGPGADVLVLSDRLWRTAFAADPAVIGRVVRLGDRQTTIVGVMPARFALPVGVDLWHPGHISPRNFQGYRGDGSRFVEVIARVAPQQSLAALPAALDGLSRRLASAYPATDANWNFVGMTLRDSLFGDYGRALVLLASAVALVLLVAAVNIAGLQLARNAAREPEFILRGALGITRAQLLRQLLTESLLLTGTGALAGLALAPLLLRLLNARLPAALTQLQAPRVDAFVALLTIALTLLVGTLTAIAPALSATRRLATPGSRVVGTRSGKVRFGSLGRGFAAAQIALALVLLTLSAVVLEGLYRLVSQPLGFDAAHLVTFTVDMPWGVKPEKIHATYDRVTEALSRLPGVVSVGANSALPLAGYSFRRTFDIAGQAPTLHHDAVVAEGRTFTVGYLATMRIPLLAGRDFDANDVRPGASPVLIVNRTLAARYFPGVSPLGQRLKNGEYSGEIVGVAGDVQGTGGSLEAPVQPELYSPEDGGWPHMQYVLRTGEPLSSLEPAIRRMVPSIDATASPGHFVTFTGTLDRTMTQPRLNAGLLTAFAVLSLLLVVIGVYGLVAFELSRRTRELGVRLALGSTRGRLLRLLLGESARTLAAGTMLGGLVGLAAHHLLVATLPGVGSRDALMLLGCACAVLACAVFAATWLPAGRAVRLNPADALKSTWE